MDDKQFDGIMHRYVSSTAKGKEEDLQKLNMEQHKTNAMPKPKRMRLVLVTAIPCLVVMIALAIVLPLTLTPNGTAQNTPTQNEPVDDTYSFDGDIYSLFLNSASELEEHFGEPVILPTRDAMAITYALMLIDKDPTKILGARIETSIYDEIFDTVNMYILPEKNEFGGVEMYKYLSNTASWQNIDISYSIKYLDFDGSCTTRI